MKCIGNYDYESNSLDVNHFPINVTKNVESKQPNYFVKKQCEEHENCIFCLIRGIPFHGKDFDYFVHVFSQNKINIDEHPTFFNYEQTPSLQNKPYSSLNNIELLEIINTQYSFPKKREFDEN